jgi:hypothetical protein
MFGPHTRHGHGGCSDRCAGTVVAIHWQVDPDNQGVSLCCLKDGIIGRIIFSIRKEGKRKGQKSYDQVVDGFYYAEAYLLIRVGWTALECHPSSKTQDVELWKILVVEWNHLLVELPVEQEEIQRLYCQGS